MKLPDGSSPSPVACGCPPMESQPPPPHRVLPRVRCVKSGLASRATKIVTQAMPNCRTLVRVGAGSAAASSLTLRTGNKTGTVLRVLTRANSPLLVAPRTPACPVPCSVAALPLPPSLVGDESRRLSHMNLVHKVLTETLSMLENGGPSVLEQQAVKPPTLKDYRRRLAAFDAFCTASNLGTDTHDGLDRALLEYFDTLFMNGDSLDAGTKALAAVGHRSPEYYRSGRTGLLPRARRALQGWHRVAPLPTRLPIPWPGLSACACMLLGLGHRLAALAVFLAADA